VNISENDQGDFVTVDSGFPIDNCNFAVLKTSKNVMEMMKDMYNKDLFLKIHKLLTFSPLL
jgi:hypothetical protein